jgi:hypothetical protein
VAPKHHPTPLSGGDRKALSKELGKVRAMTAILAAQSAEARAQGRSSPPDRGQAVVGILEREGLGRRRSDRPVPHHRPGRERRLPVARELEVECSRC